MGSAGLGRRGRPPGITTNEDGSSTIKVKGVAYNFGVNGKAGRLNSKGGQTAEDRTYAAAVFAQASAE